MGNITVCIQAVDMISW